jgi:hypothetical protein
MFDVLGRRVRAPLVNKQAGLKRQKAASGVYFERTIDNVKKTVRKRIGI